MSAPLKLLSLGAGVQSTVLALMSARGDLPRLDAAIFADTGWEPAAVYAHLDWLEAQLPFPVYRVSAGDIRADAMAGTNTGGRAFASIPWYTISRGGKKGMGRRQCTKEYKLRPIQRKVVDLLGGRRPAGGAEVWIGISVEEIWRQKPSRVRYIVNRWPLLEIRMRRGQALEWLAERQYPIPPKSACLGCPFHSDAQWASLTPAEFADAVEVDESIRALAGPAGPLKYAHRSLQPLSEIDFTTLAQAGQGDLFNMECEGLCGV